MCDRVEASVHVQHEAHSRAVRVKQAGWRVPNSRQPEQCNDNDKGGGEGKEGGTDDGETNETTKDEAATTSGNNNRNGRSGAASGGRQRGAASLRAFSLAVTPMGLRLRIRLPGAPFIESSLTL